MRVSGYTRNGKTVVNTDTTKLELIHQQRAQKKERNQISSELNNLRELVMSLMNRIEDLENRG